MNDAKREKLYMRGHKQGFEDGMDTAWVVHKATLEDVKLWLERDDCSWALAIIRAALDAEHV